MSDTRTSDDPSIDLRVSVDPVVEAPPAIEPEIESPEPHDVTVADEGSFTVARCACGWRSYARRSRQRARAEGADHTLLYGPPSSA
jgi:hypothetical protein